MKLESQVNSIEQGKRLLELGITAQCLYYWYRGLMTEHHGIQTQQWCNERMVSNAIYPSFTVAELGAMLTGCDKAESTVWDIDAHTFRIDGGDKSNNYLTEAECRAAMLIHLLENGYTTAAECNERLNNA